MRRIVSTWFASATALFLGMIAAAEAQQAPGRGAPVSRSAVDAPATPRSTVPARTQARPAPSGAAAQRPAPSAESVRKLEALLRLWEQQSSKVETLDVRFTREDKSKGGVFNDPVVYQGRAILKSPNLAYLDLHKVKLDANSKPISDATGKFVTEAYERIICTGREVWQIMPPTRQILIHTLAQDQKQRALEEGPLPFLFNMRAEEAKNRYEMMLAGESEESYGIRIIPKLEIDKESFRMADVQLDKKLLQPRWLRLYDINGTDTREFWFAAKDFRPNYPVVDSNFQPKAADYKGYTVERNVLGDPGQKAAAAESPAARRTPATANPAPPASRR